MSHQQYLWVRTESKLGQRTCSGQVNQQQEKGQSFTGGKKTMWSGIFNRSKNITKNSFLKQNFHLVYLLQTKRYTLYSSDNLKAKFMSQTI